MARKRVTELREVLCELTQELNDVSARVAQLEVLKSSCETLLDYFDSQEEGEEIDSCTTLYHTSESSVEARLVELAADRGGELRSGEVRIILVSEGLLRGEVRTTATRLYEAFRDSERFEKTGKRGYWRLISEDVKEAHDLAEPSVL